MTSKHTKGRSLVSSRYAGHKRRGGKTETQTRRRRIRKTKKKEGYYW